MKQIPLVAASLFSIFATTTTLASSITFFDDSFTGSELHQQVLLGNASYPTVTPTINGDRADFGVGGYSDVLYRMAIVEAGDMAGNSDLNISITADWE